MRAHTHTHTHLAQYIANMWRRLSEGARFLEPNYGNYMKNKHCSTTAYASGHLRVYAFRGFASFSTPDRLCCTNAYSRTRDTSILLFFSPTRAHIELETASTSNTRRAVVLLGKIV